MVYANIRPKVRSLVYCREVGDIGIWERCRIWVQRDRQTDEKRAACPNLLRAIGAKPRKGRGFLDLKVNRTSTLGDTPAFLGSP